jgi:exonuclease I
MPWLREEGNSYVSSIPVQGTENMKVADLMDNTGSSWNWGLIEGFFNTQDREAISKVSLMNNEKEDKLIWKFNNRGIYTVKSAYRYAMETLVDNLEYRIPGEWTSLWRMKIPQKVKVFLRRALRGVLPTRMRP